MRRRASVQAELDEAKRVPRPALEGQRQFLETLVDDWTELTIEERKRLVAFVFEEIHADVAGVTKFRAKDDWKRYMTAVVGVLENGGVSERKTGLAWQESGLIPAVVVDPPCHL